MMKRLVLAVTTVVLACGFALAQEEPGPNFEHLKAHGIVIGTWRYEGPLLEDVPGFAKKGSQCVDQSSWRWVLNKNAIEVTWRSEFEGGKTLSGRGLVGWNAADKKIMFGGMDSAGSMSIGTIAFEDDGKTSSLTGHNIDSDGKTTTFKNVIKMQGEDTFTIQTTERGGGAVDGPGPVYTFKRVEREERRKRKPAL
jgi:hypothetical protein